MHLSFYLLYFERSQKSPFIYTITKGYYMILLRYKLQAAFGFMDYFWLYIITLKLYIYICSLCNAYLIISLLHNII